MLKIFSLSLLFHLARLNPNKYRNGKLNTGKKITINNHLVLAICSHFLDLKLLIDIHKLITKVKKNNVIQLIHDIVGKNT